MKNFRKILYLCLLVSPFVLSALFYSKYPDQVAVHWNSQGIADSFVSKNFAAWGIPGILLVIIIFFQLSRQNRTGHESGGNLLFAIGTWGVAIVPVIVQSVILFMIGEMNFKWGFIISIIFGILIAVIGVLIPKMEAKMPIAYVTPWTASDQSNKEATIKCASVVWVLCGIAICLSVLLLAYPVIVGTIDILVFVAIFLFPRLYSLYYFKKYGKGKR